MSGSINPVGNSTLKPLTAQPAPSVAPPPPPSAQPEVTPAATVSISKAARGDRDHDGDSA